MYLLLFALFGLVGAGEVRLISPRFSHAFASASAGSAALPVLPVVSYVSPLYIRGTQYLAQDSLGQYRYGYTTGNGIVKNEVRYLSGDVTGGYAYISPEGQRIRITYTAGDGGFKAEGEAIPKPVKPTEEVLLATKDHLEAKSTVETNAGKRNGDKPSEADLAYAKAWASLPFV